MKSDEIEDGSPCPYCGVLAIFFDGAADITCPNCGSELINISTDDNVDGNDLDLLDMDIDMEDGEAFESSDEGDF
jgi:DNA-directed RNA polymerase subunit RPC12/RpoP